MALSVIVPALNEQDFITCLLDSLANQTYKDFEVVVVDGNSDDKTRDVVANYKKIKNLRVINAKTKGVSLQRNLGAKNAKYDNLIFVDADEYVQPDFFEKIVEFIQANPDIDIMTTWVKPISEKKRDKILYYTYNQFYLEVMKNIKPQGGGAFIFIKKKVFDDLNGFNEKFFIAEDHDLFVRAYNKGFKYHLLKDPAVKTSVRRLEHDGRLRHIWTMSKGAVYMHFVSPINISRFIDYNISQGGAMYKNIKSKIK